jgi:hypothetical protein
MFLSLIICYYSADYKYGSFMTTISNDRVNSLMPSEQSEAQPGMGEMRVLNTTKQIEVLRSECRAKQAEMDTAEKKRLWIDLAVMIIGVAVFIIALTLGLTGILSPVAAVVVGLVGGCFYGAGCVDISMRRITYHYGWAPGRIPYEQAAKAIEVQGEDGFLQFAETQKISLNLENVLPARKLYNKYNWDKRQSLQRRELEKWDQQDLEFRINKLRSASL